MDLRAERVRAQVDLANDLLRVAIEDAREEALALFSGLDGDGRTRFAREAWSIGLMAIRNAHMQAEEAKLKDVGRTLVDDLEKQLRSYLEAQEKTVKGVLSAYFAPDDGQVTQRLKAFISDDGELARVLRAHVAPEDSVLAKSLAQLVGDRSVLFRRLDPQDSEGLVVQLEKRIGEALVQGKEGFSAALDPLQEDSPVARFLVQLRARLKEADENREKQLKTLTAALDEGNEDSLLSRLKRDVEKANRDLLRAINPADPASPMGLIKGTIEKLVQKHMEENKELLEKAEERQKKFQIQVTEALSRLETQKQEASRSTHGGYEFEEAVQLFIQAALSGGPYVTELTHNTTGLLPGRRVGDHVIRFTAEHAFAGGGVVVEAKRAHQYSVAKALEEIAEARENRDCQAGVFVLAASRAPPGFPRFSRYGQDVLVTWDPDDATTDAYLHAALVSGLALVARKKAARTQGDITALNDIDRRVRDEIERLGTMEKLTQNILRDADKIEKAIGTARGKLDILVRKAAETLKALDVELIDEDEERLSPIGIDEGSLERGQDAIRGLRVDGDAAPAWDDGPRATVDAAALAAYRARKKVAEDPQ